MINKQLIHRNALLLVAACAIVTLPVALHAAEPIGAFESHGDVGVNPSAGSAEFNTASATYKITGGGHNMWGEKDAFHYVWKKVSGDIAIETEMEFLGVGVNPHRKAGVLIRQTLDESSPYVDAIVHGDGTSALQFRRTPGAITEKVDSHAVAPRRLRLERRGNQFTMYAADPGRELVSKESVTLALTDLVYVGLAVCAHDVAVLETAVFSRVKIEAPERRTVRSLIHVYDLETRDVKTVYLADRHIEAPNWSPDGRYLLVNSRGGLYRLSPDLDSPTLARVNLGVRIRANNDHGISPDGKFLAISGSTENSSQIFTANADGSNVKLITPKFPSYYHGMSPDGKWLAYTALRDGDFDLHRIPAAGGEEERLNRADGLDDGPDYSPDGKWIYFNSIRTGNFDIWRIPADGAGKGNARATQITNDEMEDWFPHPSPDGKWVVMLSFAKGVVGHPANHNVKLRLMPMPGDAAAPANPETILDLFGGQGTMNVNSWSPDSKRFAFVSYELIHR